MQHAPGVTLSVLSADFSRLKEEIQLVAQDIEFIHVDVMDGQFVPNLTFGVPVVQGLRKATTAPLACHLMVRDPERYVDAFAEAGASVISIHPEATVHVQRTLAQIRSLGKQSGMALCPHTHEETLRYVLRDLDVVTVMAVNPGFGGQVFLPSTVEKIARIRKMIDESGLPIRLEVDGGINSETAELVARAGADLLVAGSAVFSAPDRREAVLSILRAARRGAGFGG